MKSRVEKKMVPNLHFWARSFRHFDDLQSNLFFPRSVRIDFSRSVIFNLFQRVLPEEIRFFIQNLIGFFLRPFFSTEKRQNHSKIDVLQIARNSRTLWWKIIKFYTQNMPRKNFSPAKTPRNCNFLFFWKVHKTFGFWTFCENDCVLPLICDFKR